MRNVECGMRNVKDARKEEEVRRNVKDARKKTEKIDRDREER